MAVTVASLMTKMGYDDSELVAGLAGSKGVLSGFMGGLTGILTTGVVVAGAAVGAIGESFMHIQDALTPVMTLTGSGTQQFKDMSEAIKGVITSSPKSADDIGMAAYKILSSGITDAVQANLALIASNELALAGLGSVTQASDLISSAMAVWKDSGQSAEDVAKTFFGTIQVGKTTTADLASGFGTIAPLAQIAGLSLNDLMSATAALTVTGMPAATAYTNLRNILSNIIKPTKEARGEAAQLGIDFSTSALKSEGMRGFLQDVWAKTSGDPDKISKLFGNIRGLTGAIALMGPEADQYATDITSINDKGQLLGERAGEVRDTFSNRIKELKNNVIVHLADLGQNGLDWIAKKWQDWGPGIKDVANHLKDDLGAIFDAIKDHLRDFVTGWISSGADSPSGFFENFGSIARGVYESILSIFRVIKSSFLDFITGWSDGGEGGPSGFWQRLGSISEQIGQGILDLFANIKTAFKGFVTGWTSTGEDSPSGFWENLGSKAEGVKDNLVQWFDNIKTAWAGFITGWKSEGKDSPSGFFENLGSKAAGANTGLSNLNQSLKDFKESIGSDKITKALDILGTALDGIGHGAVWALTQNVGALNLAWRVLSEEVIPAATLIFRGFKGVITEEIIPALDLFGHFISDTLGPVLRVLKDIINQEVVPALDLIGSSVAVGSIEPLRLMVRVIKEEVIPAFWLIVDAVTGAGNATIGVLGWLKDQVLGKFADAGSWLWSAGQNLIQGFINGILAKINPLKGILSFVTAVTKNGKGPPEVDKRLLFPAGQMIMGGFINGIDSLTANLYRHLQDITKNTGTTMHVSAAGFKGSSSSSVVNYGAPNSVVINMPNGSNGEDVVRALRNWARANGKVPIAVTGRSS